MPEGMRIGELAAQVDASPVTSKRGHNGYRFYDHEAPVRAANVKTPLDVGLTAEDVRQHAESGRLDEPLDEVQHCDGELAPIHFPADHSR